MSMYWGMPLPCSTPDLVFKISTSYKYISSIFLVLAYFYSYISLKASCGACGVCYDCNNPECQCALPDGMKNCKMFPAEMKIDYIRLYQVEIIKMIL